MSSRSTKKRFARRLRHQLYLQKPVSTKKNDYGDEESVWQDVAPVRAEVKPLSGREYFYAAQTESVITHMVVCRPPGDCRVDSSMRFRWPDRRHGTERYLYITGVVDIEERGQMLELRCLEP